MKKHLLKLQKVKNNIILPLALIMCSSISAQVGIGTETPSATSVLDVESTTKGFLPPRLSTIQRDKILSPAEGLVIYNTSIHCLEFYNKTVWFNVCNTVAPTPTPINIVRIGFLSHNALGGRLFEFFNDQLKTPANYGPKGTYKGTNGFSFSNLGVGPTIAGTATELKANYDIICTGSTTILSTAAATKLKEYVDLGGVLIALLDGLGGGRGTEIHQAFGGTGSVIATGAGGMPIRSSAILSSTFGANDLTRLRAATGFHGGVKVSQLPPGSTLLASKDTYGTGYAGLWVTGPGGRAIFSWDEGMYRYATVKGPIDNDQEVFLHNLMVYAIDKARGLP